MMICINRSIAATAVAIAIGATPGISFAQLDASFDRPAPNAPMQITVNVHNGIRYLNGGFGATERAQMVNAAKDFNVLLVFSERKDDAYVKGVNVVVRDTAGKPLFDLAGAGPMLWLKLPKGTYVVDTTLKGDLKKRIVTVGETIAAQEHFLWENKRHAS